MSAAVAEYVEKRAAAKKPIRADERIKRTEDRYVASPQPGPQERFLRSTADIAIYGGSAGAGKKFC